jgi:pimeloyl-ACP methyl ester carboxylesterase
MHKDMIQESHAKSVAGMEQAAFGDAGGEQLYRVLHRSDEPIGQVLLMGHFVTERPFSYAPWVRWARHLAQRNLSALRFDYRGCGESTGTFERFTFASWLEDCRFAYGTLEAQNPGLPIVLNGIGLGALFAARLFQEGLGAALLLWSPPSNGADSLRDTLLRRSAFDVVNTSEGRPASKPDYKASLEAGQSVEAAGYLLTPGLWREATAMNLALPAGGGSGGVDARGREWKVRKLKQSEVPLVPGGGVWQALNPGIRMRGVPLSPDMGVFFQENSDWIRAAIQKPAVKS